VKSHSQVDGGFEAGLLLSRSWDPAPLAETLKEGFINFDSTNVAPLFQFTPSNFSEPFRDFELVTPFQQWLHDGGEMWGLPMDYLAAFKQMHSVGEMYRYVIANKGSRYELDHSYPQKLIHESKFIVDKTPAYVYELPEILSFKLPHHACPPVFMSVKPFKDQLHSWLVKHPSPDVIYRLRLTMRSMKWLLQERRKNSVHGAKVLVWDYKALMQNFESFRLQLSRALYMCNPELPSEPILLKRFEDKFPAAYEREVYSKPVRGYKPPPQSDKVDRWMETFAGLAKEFDSYLQQLSELSQLPEPSKPLQKAAQKDTNHTLRGRKPLKRRKGKGKMKLERRKGKG